MPKELYEIEISDHMYVMAKSAQSAERIARRHMDEIDCNVNAYIATSYYAEWKNVIPYNADDDDIRTVKEIVEEMIEVRKKAKYIKNHYRELPFKK